MAEHSTIEWTDATWNPITGCTVLSPGCTNCYAMKEAGGRLRSHPSRKGLTRPSKAGPVWTGEVRFNEDWIDQPLRWKRPRLIFVCAHGDLFHESVPDVWIDRVFAVMALAPRHTFQVLTKRSARMRQYMLERWQPTKAQRIDFGAGDVLDIPAATSGETRRDQIARACEEFIQKFNLADQNNEAHWTSEGSLKATRFAWPLPNVWLGVSVEDQQRADERIPDLLATPAAVRFLSCEPLLGPIRFKDVPGFNRVNLSLWGWWVIAGGESKAGARPSHPDWFRSLRDQCAVAGVPFFFKQWGEWCAPQHLPPGTDFSHVHDYIGDCYVTRVGKKAAGALLDGVEHKAMPNG
jgi:protein gp37